MDTKLYSNPNPLLRNIILRNIYTAIKKLHSIDIAHLDIKPENILVNPETGDIKIIDFGFSCNNAHVICEKKIFGTLFYMDCRLFHKIHSNDRDITIIDYKKADIWAFGIICIEFVNVSALKTSNNERKPLFLLEQNMQIYDAYTNTTRQKQNLLQALKLIIFNYFFIFKSADTRTIKNSEFHYLDGILTYYSSNPAIKENQFALYKKTFDDAINTTKFGLDNYKSKIEFSERWFIDLAELKPLTDTLDSDDDSDDDYKYSDDEEDGGGKLIKYTRRNKKRKNKPKLGRNKRSKKRTKRRKPKRKQYARNARDLLLLT